MKFAAVLSDDDVDDEGEESDFDVLNDSFSTRSSSSSSFVPLTQKPASATGTPFTSFLESHRLSENNRRKFQRTSSKMIDAVTHKFNDLSTLNHAKTKNMKSPSAKNSENSNHASGLFDLFQRLTVEHGLDPVQSKAKRERELNELTIMMMRYCFIRTNDEEKDATKMRYAEIREPSEFFTRGDSVKARKQKRYTHSTLRISRDRRRQREQSVEDIKNLGKVFDRISISPTNCIDAKDQTSGFFEPLKVHDNEELHSEKVDNLIDQYNDTTKIVNSDNLADYASNFEKCADSDELSEQDENVVSNNKLDSVGETDMEEEPQIGREQPKQMIDNDNDSARLAKDFSESTSPAPIEVKLKAIFLRRLESSSSSNEEKPKQAKRKIIPLANDYQVDEKQQDDDNNELLNAFKTEQLIDRLQRKAKHAFVQQDYMTFLCLHRFLSYFTSPEKESLLDLRNFAVKAMGSSNHERQYAKIKSMLLSWPSGNQAVIFRNSDTIEKETEQLFLQSLQKLKSELRKLEKTSSNSNDYKTMLPGIFYIFQFMRQLVYFNYFTKQPDSVNKLPKSKEELIEKIKLNLHLYLKGSCDCLPKDKAMILLIGKDVVSELWIEPLEVFKELLNNSLKEGFIDEVSEISRGLIDLAKEKPFFNNTNTATERIELLKKFVSELVHDDFDFHESESFFIETSKSIASDSDGVLIELATLVKEIVSLSDIIVQLSKLKSEAKQYFLNENYHGAIEIYTTALSYCKKENENFTKLTSTLLTNRAACNFFLKFYTLTIQDCNLALEMDPFNIKASIRKAKALGQMSEFDSAIETLKKINATKGSNLYFEVTKELAKILELKEENLYNAGKQNTETPPARPATESKFKATEKDIDVSISLTADEILGAKNFYLIFGVESTASSKEIKKSYHKLALRFHPDKLYQEREGETKNNENSASNTEVFKKIRSCFEILSDPIKRRKYDLENIQNNNTSTKPSYSNYNYGYQYNSTNGSSNASYNYTFNRHYGGTTYNFNYSRR